MKRALITGASEGIGYEFVKLFAKDGYELVLVARNEEKLKSIVEELTQQGLTSSYYAIDLSDLDKVKFLFDDLKSKQMDIDCLVNNAGFGLSGAYIDLSWEDQNRMYQLDMVTVAYITHHFAREMKVRGQGRIMNLASIAAFMPIPEMAGYGASKSFVLSLSDAINTELKGSGVTITTLCPGVTRTKFHEVAHTERSLLGSSFLPQATPDQVALYGYRSMMKGKTIAIHLWANRFLIGLVRVTPKCIIRLIMKKSMQA